MCLIKNEKILITGGTGSLGKALAEILATSNRVVIYSRNEERQFEMQQALAHLDLEYIIGDVRDRDTLSHALKSCSLAIHAAAMKDMIMCEKQPTQAYSNNIEGSRIFLEAVFQSRVKKAVGISTDKASSPVNVYGATKYIMEQLFIEASRNNPQNFLCVRFGNMIDSKGSLISKWKEKPDQNIQITHQEVSRFFFTKKEAALSVISALKTNETGKIFIPKMKKVKIMDILKIITGKEFFKVMGLFPGEKLHELLISEEERRYCFEQNNFFIIDPKKVNPQPPPTLSSETALSFTKEELYNMIFPMGD